MDRFTHTCTFAGPCGHIVNTIHVRRLDACPMCRGPVQIPETKLPGVCSNPTLYKAVEAALAASGDKDARCEFEADRRMRLQLEELVKVRRPRASRVKWPPRPLSAS